MSKRRVSKTTALECPQNRGCFATSQVSRGQRIPRHVDAATFPRLLVLVNLLHFVVLSPLFTTTNAGVVYELINVLSSSQAPIGGYISERAPTPGITGKIGVTSRESFVNGANSKLFSFTKNSWLCGGQTAPLAVSGTTEAGRGLAPSGPGHRSEG